MVGKYCMFAVSGNNAGAFEVRGKIEKVENGFFLLNDVNFFVKDILVKRKRNVDDKVYINMQDVIYFYEVTELK